MNSTKRLKEYTIVSADVSVEPQFVNFEFPLNGQDTIMIKISKSLMSKANSQMKIKEGS